MGFRFRVSGNGHLPVLMLFVVLALCTEIISGITNGQGSKWDFANFYDAGHKVLAGEFKNLYNPSATIEGRPSQGDMPFYGTPLSAILYVPLAMFPPDVSLVLFKIQNTLANLAGIVLLYLKNRRFGETASRSGTVFLTMFTIAAALFQPFWDIYHIGGQTTPTVFLALVLAFHWLVQGRDFLAALCFVFAVAIKPAFVFALTLLALLSGLRFTGYAAGIGLSIGATSVAWMGWPIHEIFLRHILKQYPKSWIYNSSLSVAFDNLRMVFDTSSAQFPIVVMGALVRLGAASVFTWLYARHRLRIPSVSGRRHLDFHIAVTSCLLIMPVIWEHYLALLFIPLSYCLAIQHLLPRKAAYMLALIFLASIMQNVNVIMWLDTSITIDTPAGLFFAGLLKSAPLVLTALLLAVYHRDVIDSYFSPEWQSGRME